LAKNREASIPFTAGIRLLVVCALPLLLAAGFDRGIAASAQNKSTTAQASAISWHATRTSPLDLEIGGNLAGLPPNTARYLTRNDLLALPQATYTTSDDPNFTGSTKISGVLLSELLEHLSASPSSDLVVASCDDLYRANYPQSYIAAHHPLLVLKVNGKDPDAWPKDSEGHGLSMGPYLISHPAFTPSFKILAHSDESQIPWGVVRLEFRNEKKVFGAIAPAGPHAADQSVQAGYRIAQQNCFRCHNRGEQGGQKAGRPWAVLSAWASASPARFAAFIKDPTRINSKSQMPGNPAYDDATLQALTAYFQTFQDSKKEGTRQGKRSRDSAR
jgi:mono/diheme cytochrome c family protein